MEGGEPLDGDDVEQIKDVLNLHFGNVTEQDLAKEGVKR